VLTRCESTKLFKAFLGLRPLTWRRVRRGQPAYFQQKPQHGEGTVVIGMRAFLCRGNKHAAGVDAGLYDAVMVVIVTWFDGSKN
jgi:hypothetical protein